MTTILRMVDGLTGTLTAQQERQSWAAVHGGGSGRQLGGRSGFRVGTPSTVLSATSTTWTLGACSAMLDPGAQTHQGMYGWSSDANITGTVTAADSTNPRKDIVYIQVNDSDVDSSGAKSAPVLYLAGTPGSTPSAPALPARSFLVGTISVPVAGGGSPTVALNPARYVAAGAPLPVKDQAERDALSLYDGLSVQRMDLPGRPTERYDGAKWTVSDLPWTDAPLAQGFEYFSGNGWGGLKYCVKSGWVMINGAVSRSTSWPSDMTCAVMPANLKPAYRVQGSNVSVEPSGGNVSLPAGSAATSLSATWPLF